MLFVTEKIQMQSLKMDGNWYSFMQNNSQSSCSDSHSARTHNPPSLEYCLSLKKKCFIFYHYFHNPGEEKVKASQKYSPVRRFHRSHVHFFIGHSIGEKEGQDASCFLLSDHRYTHKQGSLLLGKKRQENSSL